eukprot:6608588-Pyramimonas_sp.AAC.1
MPRVSDVDEFPKWRTTLMTRPADTKIGFAVMHLIFNVPDKDPKMGNVQHKHRLLSALPCVLKVSPRHCQETEPSQRNVSRCLR